LPRIGKTRKPRGGKICQCLAKTPRICQTLAKCPQARLLAVGGSAIACEITEKQAVSVPESCPKILCASCVSAENFLSVLCALCGWKFSMPAKRFSMIFNVQNSLCRCVSV
jgi:hypothetical protein